MVDLYAWPVCMWVRKWFFFSLSGSSHCKNMFPIVSQQISTHSQQNSTHLTLLSSAQRHREKNWMTHPFFFFFFFILLFLLSRIEPGDTWLFCWQVILIFLHLVSLNIPLTGNKTDFSELLWFGPLSKLTNEIYQHSLLSFFLCFLFVI